MRARWLKPESYQDRVLAKLGANAFAVYHALRCLADDGGTVEADADLVYGRFFLRWPSITLSGVSVSITQLHNEHLITLFTVGPDTYAKIAGWKVSDIPHPGKFRHPQLEVGQALTRAGTVVTTVALSEDSCDPLILDTYNPRHLDTQTPTSCAEAPEPAPAAPVDEVVVMRLPCIANVQGWPVTESQLVKWRETFPAVDVIGELRKMSAWLDANSGNRKTYKGTPRFVVSWLGRAQDRGPITATAHPPARVGAADRQRATLDAMLGKGVS